MILQKIQEAILLDIEISIGELIVREESGCTLEDKISSYPSGFASRCRRNDGTLQRGTVCIHLTPHTQHSSASKRRAQEVGIMAATK